VATDQILTEHHADGADKGVLTALQSSHAMRGVTHSTAG
jgi:hypothetical protein